MLIYNYVDDTLVANLKYRYLQPELFSGIHLAPLSMTLVLVKEDQNVLSMTTVKDLIHIPTVKRIGKAKRVIVSSLFVLIMMNVMKENAFMI